MGDVGDTTLAGARLGEVDNLVVAVLAGVALEDVDDTVTVTSRVAVAGEALVDGSDGGDLGGGGAGDGLDKGGGQSGDISDSSSLGESDIGTNVEVDLDKDSEEDGVGNGLAGSKLVAAGERDITTAELRVVTGAGDVAAGKLNARGVGRVYLVTTVAVVLVDTEEVAALAGSGAELEVLVVRGINKLEGRVAGGRANTTEENKVLNLEREAVDGAGRDRISGSRHGGGTGVGPLGHGHGEDSSHEEFTSETHSEC